MFPSTARTKAQRLEHSSQFLQHSISLNFSHIPFVAASFNIFLARTVCGGRHPTSHTFKRRPSIETLVPEESLKRASLVSLLKGCNISTNDKLFFWHNSSAARLLNTPTSGEKTFWIISRGVKLCPVRWIILI